MICAHCAHSREVGHWGVTAPVICVQAECQWKGMMDDVREFVKQCLYCVDSRAGEMVPRPHGETVYISVPDNGVRFDFLYVGDTGPAGSGSLPEGSEFRHTLVMMDDVTYFVWLQPTRSCIAEVTARSHLLWCITLGVPRA